MFLSVSFSLSSLLDGDGDPDGVDGGLDEDPLPLVPGDYDWAEEELLGGGHLHLKEHQY